MDNVVNEIYQKILSNKSLLPAVPAISIKILKALENPNCDVKLFSRIIENDVGLAAFILKTSRSPRFLTHNPPNDLESAIVRMGMKETYYLSLAFLSRSVFSSSNKGLQKLLKDAHQFSTKLAVISCFLAGSEKNLSPSQAMLAGLFQDIGVPAILVALADYPNIMNDEQKRTHYVDQLAPRVGALILKNWGFDDMLNIALSRKVWALDNGQEQAGLPELLLIARLHAMLGTKQFNTCPQLMEVPAFNKFNFGELGPDNTLQLLKESKQELDAIQALLVA